MTSIKTYSGNQISFTSPSIEDINIEDIAQGLSNLCRFTGQCVFYTVAEHSIKVAQLVGCVERKSALAGLMHDATEAYLGDVSSPLKGMLPDYKIIEDRMWKIIATKFNLPLEIPEIVHHVDKYLFYIERADLQIEKNYISMTPSEARKAFLEKFYELST
jgi:5'-deoxynucleotidase YfbR-like HD superfamily hydrolase